MTSNASTHVKLIEPLQCFLESFTQELTEQKFIPAFRDELKRLLAALDGLQQSEDTLQQIAAGVDRLREVFAPAGARLLDGAKELESAMKANADELRSRATDTLNDLLRTHEQLESSLRNEAGLFQEHASASREAVARTVAEIEQRISGLSAHLENLCERLESEARELPRRTTKAEEPSLRQPEAAIPQTVRVVWPEDLRDLITRSERTLAEELQRQREEIAAVLASGRSDESERLARLDHKISESLSSLGPSVQEELESAVARLRDQIQTLILAEIETRAAGMAQQDGEAAPPGVDVAAAVTASETRILRELSSLHKTQRTDHTEAVRVLRELVQGFEQAAERMLARADADTHLAKESLSALQRTLAQFRDNAQKERDQLAQLQAGVDALGKGHRDHQQYVEEEFHATRSRLDGQARVLEQKVEEDRQLFSQLSSAMGRAEQAATKATELALADSRAQREKIEAGLRDIRERLDRGIAAEAERSQETLRKIAEAWTEALETLRDFIQKTLAARADVILGRLDGLEGKIAQAGTGGSALQKELSGEIKRVSAVFDDRLETLQSTNAAFATAVQNHVQAVSGEVAALRAKQEQSLAVLREAIRANYDEAAVRLKEVVESACDSFVRQTTSIPQVLDRFSHLIQSLHQGEELTLQAIASDTKNVLNLSAERFDLVLADSTAVKKFFPLLDRKLEKYAADIESVRKAQVQQEKHDSELRASLIQNQEWQEEQGRELKSDLKRMGEHAQERFQLTREDLAALRAELSSFQGEDLPGFRRELAALLASKFEFMETTLRERQETLRLEVFERLSAAQASSRRAYVLVAALAALAVGLQLALHFGMVPGLGK